MQRYGPDPHSFYLFDKCLLSPVTSRQGTLLGVGNTGVSSHGFGPHVDFIWEERRRGERRWAGNLDVRVVNQLLVCLFGWQNIFVCLSFSFSVVTPYSVTVIITNLVPVGTCVVGL